MSQEGKRSLSPSPPNAETKTAKRARCHEGQVEIQDLCHQFQLKDGDRIEVGWHVNDQEELYWWGATLLPWNGQDVVDETVAVRELKYDAYPAAGFDEESLEKVVFLGEHLLAYPHSGEELNFRRPGEDYEQEEDDDEEEEEASTPVRANPTDLVAEVLQRVVDKHRHTFEQLSAAQQAAIAAKMNEKREQLIEQLENSRGEVTASRMQDILAHVSSSEESSH